MAPGASIAIGLMLALLGAVMLTGRTPLLRTPHLPGRFNPTDGLGSMALYGVSYAVASVGCTIGPFLAVTSITFRDGDLVTGVAAYAAYAAGMGLVVGVLAVAVALSQQAAVRVLRRTLPHLNRAGGVLLVVVGGYVAWYGFYELRVYAGGSTSDPIVESAGIVQNTLAGWVDSLGPAAFAFALAVLIAGAAGAFAIRRRRIVNAASALRSRT